MNAYIVKSWNKIEPFGDYPRDCLIGNKKLSAIQQDALQRFNLNPIIILDSSEINDLNEHITFSESTYLTKELIKDFIAKSREKRCNTICALKQGVTTLRTVTATQEVKIHSGFIEYDLRYIAEKKFRGKLQPIIIEPDHISEGIPMPKHMCGSDEYLIPITENLIAQIDHWTNLWAVNITSLLADIARIQKMSKFKLLAIALKKRSFNKWAILHNFNKIGRGCDIHPTAYIEGSTVGDNVKIGAGSIIRVSIIGDDVFLGNGVKIETSVIGKKCTILHGHILYSVLYPNIFTVAQMISSSLVGSESFIGSGVTLTDFRLDGNNITVIKDGAKVDTCNKFIGSCLGHGVYLGSGCVVAPGRTIPNSMRITPDKERVIMACSPDHEIGGFKNIKPR